VAPRSFIELYRAGLAVTVFALGCSTADARLVEGQRISTGATSITMAHYSIEIPAGYEARHVPVRADFDLSQVGRRGSSKVSCGFYLGNFSQFPQGHWGRRKPLETRGENRTTTTFQCPGTLEGLITFSGLSYKKSGDSPWTTVHYFCDDLDESGMKDMLGMVDSIKVVRPHVD
jgi:hypothetical protein